MPISDDQLKALVLNAKLVDQNQMQEIADYARNAQMSLTDALLEKDATTDQALGALIAGELKAPFIVLAKLSIPEDVSRVVPEKIARKYKVIPFERDANGIKVAMADPKNMLIQEMVSKKTGQNVIPYYATERDIYNKLWVFQKDLQKTFDTLVNEQLKSAGKTTSVDAPIAKIVTLIINYAYQDRASDLHIEPEEKDTLVRFRVDGILHDVLFLPKKLHDQVVTRIKVLSSLRTDEHMAPQDGKMRIELEEEDLDIRVSILPIVYGEKVVLRLLASHFRQFSLIDLGMNATDLQKVTNAFSKSFGLILSTGPTGSGKTTSIYSILKIINTREKNITTIEDPVEYRIKGVNQIQTNAKTDLTFASGLRSILRQDPNVIFVGEIRDSETAGIAVNASTVNVIVAQRLVRKICEMCKSPVDMKIDQLSQNLPMEKIQHYFGNQPTIRVYKGKGCEICHMTGYAGRIGLFEVLEVSNEIKKLITAKKDSNIVLQQAVKEGMTTMLDDGLIKVSKGSTTIDEVLRVTKVETI